MESASVAHADNGFAGPCLFIAMLTPDNFQYEYAVKSLRLIDGDTAALEIDLGFGLTISQSCRIIHIDAPEHTTKAGQLVTQVMAKWLATAGALSVVSFQLDKFAGRFDGTIWNHTRTQDWGGYLLANGLARIYDGTAKPPWTVEELSSIVSKASAILSA